MQSNFVPETLPKAAVLDSSGSTLERFRTTLGLYVPSSVREATATISLNPDLASKPALERAIFWHEFAHHIWATAETDSQEWMHYFENFWQNVQMTEGFELTEVLEEFFSERKKQEEMWARAITYWLLDYLDDSDARHSWDKNLDVRAGSPQERTSWEQVLSFMLIIEGFQI